MPHRCPWCLEPLTTGERGEPVCPHCERPLHGDDGEPSELDLRYEAIEARQLARVMEVLKWGVPSIAVLAVAVSLLHIGGVLLSPLVAVIHLLVMRLYVVREAARYMGPTRKLFVRWAVRFGFLWIGLPGYACMAIPFAGIVVGPATFALLTGAVHFYTDWSLSRERSRQPLLIWEKVVMIGTAVFTLAVVLAVVLGTLLIGWSVVSLFEWLRTA
jgi:hypothetical protein